MNGDEVIDPHPKSEELYLLLEGAGCAQDVIDYACHLIDEVARQSTIGKIAEEKFPSSPPDRPGWWRCKSPYGNGWWIRRVIEKRSGFHIMYRGYPFRVRDLVFDGWQFAGRVEMPGGVKGGQRG